MKYKGIYFLINNEEIVYIGKSIVSMKSRINNHLKENIKVFNKSIQHVINNEQDIHILEIDLISKHKPIYNKDCMSSSCGTINKNISIENFCEKIITKEEFLANMQGMKSMKVKKLFEIHDEIIKSNIDAKLFTYLVTNQSDTSKVISSGKNGASVKYLAGKFLVTERKVQQFVSEAIKLDLLKRVGKDLYLNPYLSKPFTATNNMLHQLQIWWDSEPEVEIQFISTKDLKEDIIKNTSKILGEIK